MLHIYGNNFEQRVVYFANFPKSLMRVRLYKAADRRRPAARPLDESEKIDEDAIFQLNPYEEPWPPQEVEYWEKVYL